MLHADKGKKSRFRQLTDLVKTGMSAATSRATSRTPSRGLTQDLEHFEPISRQGTQGLPGILGSTPGSQNLNPKGALKSALTGGASKTSLQRQSTSGPVAEGYSGSLDQATIGSIRSNKTHSEEAKSIPAMSDHSFGAAESTDAMSLLLDVIATQPSRSASSLALRRHWPVSHDSLANSLSANSPSAVTSLEHLSGNTGTPVAEGVEEKPALKPVTQTKFIPKNTIGFMSGASTGRGAVPHAPIAAAAATTTDLAEDKISPRDAAQQGLLPGALPDELAGALSPMERFMRMGNDQLQAAQMHSMAADEMQSLIPTISDAADNAMGELPVHMGSAVWSQSCACSCSVDTVSDTDVRMTKKVAADVKVRHTVCALDT